MWKVVDLEYRKNDGVVIKVISEYRLTSDNLISRKIITTELDEPSGDVIPFDDLTEEQVLTWVMSKIDQTSIETQVSNELSSLVEVENSKTTDNKLPW
jgi:hypothetical protein